VSLTFDNPTALWLLLAVPLFWAVGRFGTAYLARPVRNAAIAIRAILATALILAIAQPVLHRPSDDLSVVFAVDRSASVAVNGASAADAWLADAVKQAGPNDKVGVVDFGATAAVRRPVGAPAPLPTPVPVDPSQSNLAAALHLGTVLTPNQGAHRLVVLSDGQTSLADSLAQARQASSQKVQVDVVPVGPPAGFQEILVDSLDAPTNVRLGQSFDLGAVIESTTAGNATLRFFQDGTQISAGTVQLVEGANRFAVQVPARDKGFHSFEATIQGPKDTYPQNNTAYAYTVVGDAGSVVVVANDPNEAAGIIGGLKSSGLSVATMLPSQIPLDLSALKAYDGMVLVDTPASAFTLDQSQTVAAFAHDLGRGLVVIGGPNSYGQGKYDGTPLGDALPVDSGVPGNLDSGSVALVVVIDKSGSMDENEGSVKKMAMADKSAQLATGLLLPNDDIGVEAFDTDGTWVVPLQKVGDASNQKMIEAQIGTISASGGTDIFTALQKAYDAIHQSSARYKHIILMSDGNSLTDSDYNDLLNHIAQDKITLSTIAIGSDADKNLMQMLAKRGGGTYYYVDDAAKIPEITTRETKVVRGSSKVEASFQPQIAAPSPLLEQISGQELPKLSGYVVATPRRNVTVALQSDRKDPILVHWNYGLGRVVAWTSDLTEQWAGAWLAWPGFAHFWSQVVDWSLRPPNNPNLQISSTAIGNVVDYRVDVVNEQGVYQDLLDLRARVPAPGGGTTEIPLVQTRTGRYEARFSLPQDGAYPIQLVEYDHGQPATLDETTGVVISYPAEYRDFGVNDQNLASLAAATGGRVLHDPSDAFSRQGLGFDGAQAQPLWPLLLLLAAILFPVDVAVRRLRVDPLDLGKRGARDGWDWLQGGGRSLRRWRDRLGPRPGGRAGAPS
jgi:uncharacterized membrane protein/Mg-chelatase subunit ChlD